MQVCLTFCFANIRATLLCLVFLTGGLARFTIVSYMKLFYCIHLQVAQHCLSAPVTASHPYNNRSQALSYKLKVESRSVSVTKVSV